MRNSYSLKEHCFIQHPLDMALPKHILARPAQMALIDTAITQHKIPTLMAPHGFGKSTLIKQWLETQTTSVVWLRPTPTGSSLDQKQLVKPWLDSTANGLSDLRALAKPLSQNNDTDPPKSFRRKITQLSAIADPVIVILENADYLPIEVWLLVQNLHDQSPEACQFIVSTEQQLLPEQRAQLPLRFICADQLRFDDHEINVLLNPHFQINERRTPDSTPDSTTDRTQDAHDRHPRDGHYRNQHPRNEVATYSRANTQTSPKESSSSPTRHITDYTINTPATASTSLLYNRSMATLAGIEPELINAINGWPILLNGLSTCRQWHHGNPHRDTLEDHFSSLYYGLIEQYVLSDLSPMDYTIAEFIEHLPYVTQSLACTLWPQHLVSSALQTLSHRLLINTNPRTGQIELSEPWLNHHFHGRVPRYEIAPDELFKSAAEWYESQKLIGAALSCYVHLRQWNKVADLAENHAENLTKGNDWQRVTRWLERLPQEILSKHPKLITLLAWQSITLLRKGMATDYISRASAIEKPAPLQQHTNHDSLFLIHKLQHVNAEAEIDNLEDLSESLSLILERKTRDQHHFLINTINNSSKKSTHFANLRLYLQALQYFCRWELHQSIKITLRLIKQAMVERNATLVLNGLYLISWSLFATGEHRTLSKHAHNVSQWLTDNQFEAHPLAVWAEACQANILRESGHLGDSEQLIQALERHFNHPDAPVLHKYTTWMLRALQNHSLGNISGAQDYVERAYTIAHQLPVQFTHTIMSAPALRADIMILQDRLDDAEVLLEPLVHTYWQANPEQFDVWAIALHYLLVGIRGDCETMESQLKVLIQFGSRRKHRAFELYARSLLSVGFFRLGEHKKARHTLLALLKQLDTSGFKRLLLDRGKYMGNLLLKTSEKQATNPLLTPWLEQLHHENYGDSLHYDFIKLSKREIEILSLITQGKSNEEISQTLCRSLGTVKLHVHNIYKKLGVSSRIQAIQKCEACGFDNELIS